MRIYRIDHIGQTAPDVEAQAGLVKGLFGLRALMRWDGGVRLALPGGLSWEVLSGGDRPGFHHVAAEVPDLEAAVAELEKRGLQPVARGGWVETPLPADGGVLWRLRGPGNLSMCGDAAAIPAAVTTPDSPPPGPSIGVVALDHVCQAFPDRDEAAGRYAELAGFQQVWRTPTEEHPDMADLVLNIPGSTVCWEIIMPRGEDSFIERFLAKNGPAAHHVTFEVGDWERAMEACRHHEVPVFGDNAGRTDGAAWKDAFIHPKHTGGVLVQLFWEERPGVWVRSDKIPGL